MGCGCNKLMCCGRKLDAQITASQFVEKAKTGDVLLFDQSNVTHTLKQAALRILRASMLGFHPVACLIDECAASLMLEDFYQIGVESWLTSPSLPVTLESCSWQWGLWSKRLTARSS